MQKFLLKNIIENPIAFKYANKFHKFAAFNKIADCFSIKFR